MNETIFRKLGEKIERAARDETNKKMGYFW